MSKDQLSEAQLVILERAEELGINTFGYTVPNARFDRLKEQIKERESEPEEELSTELTRYADRAMFEAEEFEDVMPKVYLISATPDPLGSAAAMSKMYKGEVVRDISTVTDEERKHFWEEIRKTHLKAPWESIDFHFMLEGVTRAFTHQNVRQRTAVYAQESMRFAVKEKIAARPGPIIANTQEALDVWQEAITFIWHKYQQLIGMGIPAEEARGLLPHDTLTRIHYKTNLRNLVDHMGNRLCTQAQFEWRIVANGIRDVIRKYDPTKDCEHVSRGDNKEWYEEDNTWQFRFIADSDLFRPVCFQLGHCPFTAEFDRGCTIRDRVQEGKFDEIDEKEWMLDPTAGWVR